MDKNSNYKRILWVAQSALLLALLVVVQLISKVIPPSVPLISQLVTGSLVNLILVVGAGSVGFSGTAVASVLSPVLAFAFGQMTFPQMVPVVALGNLVIVAITWAFFKKNNGAANVLGIVVGAIAKCVFLWIATAALVVPLFYSGTKIASKLALLFSWPQGVTALIGGFLALLVLPAIRSAQKRQA